MRSKLFAFCIGAALWLGGCVSADRAAPAPLRLPAALRLYVFDCGRLGVATFSQFQLKREELAAVDMAIGCYLVVHPRGALLWDAGAVPDSLFGADGKGALNTAVSTRTLTSQLAQIGYAPGQITHFAVSHFHWDHVANANLFKGATWLVRPREHEVMVEDTPFGREQRARPRTDPAVWEGLKTARTVIIDGDHDVFGDGSVVLKAAPGHSPDHQVLFVDLPKTGPVLLSGDLYHYPEERSLNRVPTTEFSAAQTVASRAAIEALVRKAGAQMWIQHDLTGDAKLRKSPAFYD